MYHNLFITLARSKSIAFINEPWKYFTLVCCLFKRPSNSRSGSDLIGKIDHSKLWSKNEITDEEKQPQHRHPLGLREENLWENEGQTHKWCGRIQQCVCIKKNWYLSNSKVFDQYYEKTSQQKFPTFYSTPSHNFQRTCYEFQSNQISLGCMRQTLPKMGI